ncbi:MAG: M23 family metallopeptidase, partial [candidate division Zixibacteria bacterium]|nr:M23 family metallopeptidase [candidate division Zixibacteria bacterium]
MDRISTKRLTLLVFAALVVTAASAGALDWPLRIPIDLSSGFADYRPLHFHGGIDIRTGGRVGQPVYAPTDGYLWRVKTAYRGAGQAMYLKGDDGFIYVFGHLSRYAEKITRPLLARQLAEQKYSQDIFFPADSIRFKKGELIAH